MAADMRYSQKQYYHRELLGIDGSRSAKSRHCLEINLK